MFFLETVLPEMPKDVPLAVRLILWFQHDEDPAHCGEDMLQWLGATFPERWIEV
jgi:hypothetical protein